MRLSKPLLIIVLAVFGTFSAWVLWHYGYLGLWQAGLANAATAQILADLVISALLIIGWMVQNARQHGRNPWPFVVITLLAGSFGPLLYLLLTPAAAGQSGSGLSSAA